MMAAVSTPEETTANIYKTTWHTTPKVSHVDFVWFVAVRFGLDWI
jgi:hypothetical protein